MGENWEIAISDEIFDIRDGTHDTPKYVKDKVYPLVTSKNLKDGNIDLSNVKYISEEDFEEINKRSKVDIGDVLYAMIGTIGNPVVIKTEPKYAIKNVGLFKNKIKILNSELLKYYLESPNFYSQLEKRQLLKGTTQRFIPLGHLRKLNIPIAPFPEQRAIVFKIEELFSDLDNGIANLKKAQEQLKIYRQAVLKKAFEGGFTYIWRKENSYNMDEFLEDLKKGKDEAIKLKLIAKSNYFPDLSEKDLTYKIPDNWIYLPWKTINSNNKYAMKRGPFGSTLKKSFFVDEGYVVYEQGHAINDDPYRHRYYISEEKFKEMKAFEVKRGDMIISCSGVTLGRICLLPDDAATGVINQALLKVELDEKIMVKEYFKELFRSETFQRLIFGKSLGTAMPNMVGMTELKEIPIPVPSIAEQKVILKEIESRLSVCDKVEESISQSLEKAKALRQSILKKAFEGKLLSTAEIEKCKQEKDYEPASVLLDRIKKETKKS